MQKVDAGAGEAQPVVGLGSRSSPGPPGATDRGSGGRLQSVVVADGRRRRGRRGGVRHAVHAAVRGGRRRRRVPIVRRHRAPPRDLLTAGEDDRNSRLRRDYGRLSATMADQRRRDAGRARTCPQLICRRRARLTYNSPNRRSNLLTIAGARGLCVCALSVSRQWRESPVSDSTPRGKISRSQST